MKKFILISLLAFFALSLNTAFAQNDSIYVMKNGSIIWEYKIADIDSIVFYKPVIEEEETSGTFIDSRDDTEYSWVKIGEQVWMAENLKYLPSVDSLSHGSEDSVGFYYYVYGYDGNDVEEAKATENYAAYGVLYNWIAAMAGAVSSDANPSGVQGICPDGWHLPSVAEWTQLTDYLGGWEIAGGKLKEAGYDHWQSPNAGANNESGFTALPGGNRDSGGGFHNIGKYGIWWSSTENDTGNAWSRDLFYGNVVVGKYYDASESGFSVRCVRD
ncbi:MAG TPA: fibrobacter succinogenes major paralogous domain-containing protein [Bacteroidales bacterium]|nr:fibrobacter succinogenes major paralogous domain-containing protein [Bacteroidales bacterium]